MTGRDISIVLGLPKYKWRAGEKATYSTIYKTSSFFLSTCNLHTYIFGGHNGVQVRD